MAYTRAERMSLHKKQERLQVRANVPRSEDLTEGVPVLRTTDEGLVEYVRHNNQLYKKVYIQSDIRVAGLPAPNFDSGWVDVTDEVEYEFVHSLGSKMLLQQWYFKSDSGLIFNPQLNSMGYGSDEYGIFIEMETENKISVGIANEYIYIADTTAGTGAGGVSHADGYLRCLLWTTGLKE